MESCDDRLHELQTLIAGKQHAEAVLNDLLAQRRDLEKKVWELNYACISEQEDVDRLEDQSFKARLANFLMRGETDEDTERMELKVAAEKHDLAKQELRKLDLLITEKQDVLNRIQDAEMEYERLLQEKTEAIVSAGGSSEKDIVILKDEIAALEGRKSCFEKAKQQGRRVEKLTDSILQNLVEVNTREFDYAREQSWDVQARMQVVCAEENFEVLFQQVQRFCEELTAAAELMGTELGAAILSQFLDMPFEVRFAEKPNLSYIRDVQLAFLTLWDLQKNLQKVMLCLEMELFEIMKMIYDKKQSLQSLIQETKV